jgi:hypothetical protein
LNGTVDAAIATMHTGVAPNGHKNEQANAMAAPWKNR